jgi:hypothetical protein
MTAHREKRIRAIEFRAHWRQWQAFLLHCVPPEGQEAARAALRGLPVGAHIPAVKAILAALPFETREQFRANMRTCWEAAKAYRAERGLA